MSFTSKNVPKRIKVHRCKLCGEDLDTPAYSLFFLENVCFHAANKHREKLEEIMKNIFINEYDDYETNPIFLESKQNNDT